MKTIGIVGVGNMGTPMAKNLIKAGYPVVVYDINRRPGMPGILLPNRMWSSRS
jgi:3-hydroxyisobutyrate dehydrogenase-like beta-hydroxyacid dehydrogenase